jgi:hypothetical protein
MNRTITQVRGRHQPGRSNSDVAQVFIKDQSCPYLPRNLGTFFSNLEIFYVMMSGVQELMRKDLEGLNKLKVFDVSHNPIKRLKKNFFQDHSSLEIVSFFECELSVIEKGALVPLTNLSRANFEYNKCINHLGLKGSWSMIELDSEIEKCRPSEDDADYEDDDESRAVNVQAAHCFAFVIAVAQLMRSF